MNNERRALLEDILYDLSKVVEAEHAALFARPETLVTARERRDLESLIEARSLLREVLR